jgi:hypothetical protein
MKCKLALLCKLQAVPHSYIEKLFPGTDVIRKCLWELWKKRNKKRMVGLFDSWISTNTIPQWNKASNIKHSVFGCVVVVTSFLNFKDVGEKTEVLRATSARLRIGMLLSASITVAM